jgi:glycerophosphoryl diester phosphodiesterase
MKTVTFILSVLLLSSSLCAQHPVTFVGHRGASYLAPENTLASYEKAWELGVLAAECDVMLTGDNKVILFHDKKGKRLTGHNFIVKEVRYDEIKDYPILQQKESNLPEYNSETIPLLAEVLDALPDDRTLVIEIKTGPEILPFLKTVIENHWQSGDIAFISFDYETIVKAKDTWPEQPCYYLSMFKHDVKKKFDDIVKSNLDGVNLRHAIIDQELVESFNEKGKGVWCWTVNDPDDARRMIDLGVTAITTDRPAWLKNQIAQK